MDEHPPQVTRREFVTRLQNLVANITIADVPPATDDTDSIASDAIQTYEWLQSNSTMAPPWITDLFRQNQDLMK